MMALHLSSFISKIAHMNDPHMPIGAISPGVPITTAAAANVAMQPADATVIGPFTTYKLVERPLITGHHPHVRPHVLPHYVVHPKPVQTVTITLTPTPASAGGKKD